MRQLIKRLFLAGLLTFSVIACQTNQLAVTTSAEAPAASAVIRYQTVHHPVYGKKGMVVSQNHIATQVGQQILSQGGNAIDASVAMGFVLAVTLPRAGNLGGSGFMLIHDADTKNNTALDFRSAAPKAAAAPNALRDADGELRWADMTHGPQAPGVPGTVAGLYQAWQQFGSMPWDTLLQPALDLATDGIFVTHDLAFALQAASKVLIRFPGSATAYLKPDGSSYQAGEHFKQPDLAWSIQAIMAQGGDAFYEGLVGQRIVEHMEEVGGFITQQDLSDYQVRVREPVVGEYRGYTVVTQPPVSAGGVTLLQMLNTLEHFDLKSLGANSAASLHIIAEVMKQAAANRRFGLGDPDFVSVPISTIVGPDIAKHMASQVNLSLATPVSDIKPVDTQIYESPNTTHYSVMDKEGNAVATTYTLGHSFGSGFVVPGTGILLDNQIRNFTYNQDNHSNAIAPGKRMLSTMTPTLVLKPDDTVYMVTGTPGGGRIINVILQVIINVIDHDLNLAQATHQPRIHQAWRSANLGLETGIGIDTRRLLENLGHVLETHQTMGSVQSILYKAGVFHGAADPRRPGALALGLD
ncbi:MAG: gamma-glutamyltransferase [Pseudomonadota bacterium]